MNIMIGALRAQPTYASKQCGKFSFYVYVPATRILSLTLMASKIFLKIFLNSIFLEKITYLQSLFQIESI
jgi:hypothetical protein